MLFLAFRTNVGSHSFHILYNLMDLFGHGNLNLLVSPCLSALIVSKVSEHYSFLLQPTSIGPITAWAHTYLEHWITLDTTFLYPSVELQLLIPFTYKQMFHVGRITVFSTHEGTYDGKSSHFLCLFNGSNTFLMNSGGTSFSSTSSSLASVSKTS